MKYHILFLFLSFLSVYGDSEYPKVTICRGASSVRHGRMQNPFPWIKYKFQGCTHVKGHLIVIGVKKGMDLSFLNSIIEVYGAVIVKTNKVPVPLKNLKVIRGNHINKNITLKLYKNAKRVDLRSLRSIAYGNVEIKEDANGRYFRTIDWKSLFERPKNQKVSFPGILNCGGNPCNITCKNQCWGPTGDMCQIRSNCSSNACTQVGIRCLSDTSCCHKDCIGGCTGPTAKDCVACRKYINVDLCVPECPPEYIEDILNQKIKPNPNFKYASGLFCRKECQKHYFIQGKNCYAECKEGYYLKDRKRCEQCPNRICPTEHCRLDNLREKLPKKMNYYYRDGTMHRSLIKMLVNCTTLFGDIKLSSASSDPEHQFSADEIVRFEDLKNLKNLRHIRGVVHIDLRHHREATNLSFFSNLESITCHETNRGLEIFKGGNLRFLGFQKLRDLVVEAVKIAHNPKLCFLEHFQRRYELSSVAEVKTFHIKDNAKYEDCVSKKDICAKTCDAKRGCWGPGPTLCFTCARYKANQTCVERCEDKQGFYTTADNSSTCARCHPECAMSCSGPRSDQCIGACRNYKDGNDCVKTCPFTKFANETSGLCLLCADACVNIRGQASCSGPLAQAGPNGCARCLKIVAVGAPRCFVKKPAGFFSEEVRDDYHKKYPHIADYVDLKSSMLLFPCHHKCSSCFGSGPDKCGTCRKPFFKDGTSTCTSECGTGTYPDLGPIESKRNERHCLPCDIECFTCNGSSQFNCTKCKSYKIFTSPEQQNYFCNSTCPVDQPFSYVDDVGESFCSQELRISESARLAFTVAMPVFLVAAFIVVAVFASIYVWKRRARIRFHRESLRAKYTGRLESNEINMNVTNVSPNASQLRIIGINRIKKGNVIGAGAFGTVYKGVWMPDPETPSEIPVDVKVAIKELRNQGNKSSTEEFLSEAHLMASVDNQYCIKLLGVCMTSELMLISEFMKLGNLKNYLQIKREELGSKRLLHWAIQIAKGMDYLAARDIIHRDLAARNVLLESEDQLRITDFGLAKLLDDGHEFRDKGQRLPIKWLACECIRSQIFSTKSDVWAFGVTLWEIFTFGESPYPDLRSEYLLSYLDSGERLPQPAICTLDLFMLLIKCWLNEPDSRPTFEELVDELKKMAADPGRYLIIEGDEYRRAPLRSVSNMTTGTASSLEGAQGSGAKGGVAVVDFDFGAAAAKCLESSMDSGELIDGHYVADPTSFCAAAAAPEPSFQPMARWRQAAITESFDENDEVFNENDYEKPRQLGKSRQTSEYVAPSDEAEASPGGYMNVPDTVPLLVSNPTYSSPQGLHRRQLLDEAIEDYPLTPHTQPTQYVNVRL